MKKILLLGLVLMIVLFAACANRQTVVGTEPDVDTEQVAEERPYDFEFEDINGNVHMLSDYAGTPVYLRIWGSWCSVCVSTLDDLNEHAGAAEDYVVLTIITPGIAGEMSREDFIEWYSQYDYENIVVLVDDKAQIVDDFRVQAYPSQVFFDEEGYYITHMMGEIGKDMVEAAFKVADRM